ncbi:hypothetical protein WI40_14020 [Burkholderia ubonensis]|nr:hypothetical protein WI40_14020 [Burkholderia ubonensis]
MLYNKETRMKKLVQSLVIGLVALSLSTPYIAEAKGRYAGGKGSSHKGGKYKNAKTGNKYKRQH